MTTGDSIFTNNVIYAYVQSVRESTESGDWSVPDKIVESIAKYQLENSSGIIPPAKKIKVEILLNKADIFFTLAKYYGIIGFVLLLLQFTGILYNRLNLRIPVIVFTVLIVLLFCMHSIGLGLRWYVSGHAPWSNGYEALIYIAWASIAAGLLLASRNSITLSVTCVLAFMTLNVAHLSFMDPQITNLVPVLKSYWLVLHVATISASYAFLVMGALIAFLNLLLMIVNNKNQEYITLTINELTNTIEMAFVIGLYLLTIGVFLGAIWANESWGRYWGWDPKETWALVTVLVYSFVTHMRMVPGMKSIYSFNLAALLASGSVIMTYFGVNYYLSGLHSYASGDPVPIPAFVYYVVVVVSITAIAAYIRIRKSNLR
jgi:cytochrome c-type biogenesis protein CcsB